MIGYLDECVCVDGLVRGWMGACA